MHTLTDYTCCDLQWSSVKDVLKFVFFQTWGRSAEASVSVAREQWLHFPQFFVLFCTYTLAILVLHDVSGIVKYK